MTDGPILFDIGPYDPAACGLGSGPPLHNAIRRPSVGRNGEVMTEGEALEGALVPAPQPAGIRYEDEDKVTRVLVVVERADGSVKEYEARDPQDWEMNDPESVSAQVIRTTGLGIAGAFGGIALQAGIPSLRLSFTANPRYNLHIRNKRRAGEKALEQQ